jgi:hypothetical protein
MISLKLKRLLSDFKYDDHDTVCEYIIDNPEILEPLSKSSEFISQYFGDDIKLCLSVFQDPEEETKVLNVFIENNLSIENAFRMEQDLYSKWFAPSYPGLVTLLNFREVPNSL